ncbi:hypothetical protein ES705_13713 [subsurface metagenome]
MLFSGLLIFQTALSQPPKVDWLVEHEVIQAEKEDFPKAGIVTKNGNFISVGLDEDNLIVIKMNHKGKTDWIKSFSEKNRQFGGTCIDETSDGNLIVGGFCSNGKYQERILVKLNGSTGDTLWTRNYPNSKYGAIEGVQETINEEIIVTGYVDGNDPNGFLSMYSNAFIMKTNDTGDVVWEKELKGKNGDPKIPSGLRILQDTSNGGYIISSTVFSGKNNNMDFCLIKTDLSGNVEWINTYGGTRDEHCYDMDLTLDAGYILTGHTTSPPAVGWDAYLVKVDRYGEKIWDRSFGEPIDGDPQKIYDECYGVRSTPDGGYIISCGTGIEPEPFKDTTYWGDWRIFVVKTDSNGDFLWDFTSKDIPGEKAGEYVGICKDGGYVIFVDAGNTEYLKFTPDTVASTEFYELATPCEGGGYISPSRRYHPKNTTIKITAIPDLGYIFKGWSGDATGSENPATVTMNADKQIKATFIKTPDGI